MLARPDNGLRHQTAAADSATPRPTTQPTHVRTLPTGEEWRRKKAGDNGRRLSGSRCCCRGERVPARLQQRLLMRSSLLRVTVAAAAALFAAGAGDRSAAAGGGVSSWHLTTPAAGRSRSGAAELPPGSNSARNEAHGGDCRYRVRVYASNIEGPPARVVFVWYIWSFLIA